MKFFFIILLSVSNLFLLGQNNSDTLLLINVQTYLNDSILESEMKYKYDESLNQTMNSQWYSWHKFLNSRCLKSYDEFNRLKLSCTYADSVLIDSIVNYYNSNLLISSYRWSADLNNYQETKTIYSNHEKPVRSEVLQVTFPFNQRKEKKLLYVSSYDNANNLIEHAGYRIEDDEVYARIGGIGEIDTIAYSDSLIFRTIYKYDGENNLIEEQHHMINKIPTKTVPLVKILCGPEICSLIPKIKLGNYF